MNKDQSSTLADIFNLCMLKYIGEWLQKEHADDITQVDDEYILREMAGYDCFSLKDVLEEYARLSTRLGLLPYNTDTFGK